jgi:hypothetical protein
MKYKALILTLFVLVISLVGYTQTDPNLNKLLLINYNAYKGHSVDSLVTRLPPGYTKMSIVGSHRAEYGNVLLVFYPNDVGVWIEVKTFKYFKPWLDFSKPLPNQWESNMPLFKKEAIAFTIIYQGSSCKAGCENDPRSQGIQ